MHKKELIKRSLNFVQNRGSKWFFGRPYMLMDLFPQGIRSDFNKMNLAGTNPNDRGLVKSKEVQDGQLPVQLTHTRPSLQSKLPNGISVLTEHFPKSHNMCTVGVVIKVGSRNETHDNSGVAHFLEHVHFKGTQKRSKDQLEMEIEENGAHMNAYTSREYTTFQIDCFKDKVDWALEFLGDIISHSEISQHFVDNERDTILAEFDHVEANTQEFIMDNVHQAAYRYNSMGLPILGKTDNIKERINSDMVREFKDTYYYGNNMQLVVCGDVDHDSVTQAAASGFASIPAESKNPGLMVKENSEKPIFTASSIQIRDDDVDHAHIGVFYQVPGQNSKVFPHFLLMQRLFGNYNKKQQEEFEDQHAHQQNFHRAVWENESAISLETNYITYQDTGLFGWYGVAEDSGVRNLARNCLTGSNDKSRKIWDWELKQARNTLFQEMLEISENTNDTFQQCAQNLVQTDRRMSNQELAQRIANISCEDLQAVGDEQFMDNEFAVVWQGPIHLALPQEGLRQWNKFGDGQYFV